MDGDAMAAGIKQKTLPFINNEMTTRNYISDMESMLSQKYYGLWTYLQAFIQINVNKL